MTFLLLSQLFKCNWKQGSTSVPEHIYGAGSLHGALSAIAEAFTAKTGIAVKTSFGPSGLMREKIEAGDKAQRIVGGTTTPSEPDPIAAAFAKGKIDAMVGYCSGTEQRRKATPDLTAVEVPAPFATGPEYGLAIMNLGNTDTVALALAIEGPEGQATLARFGFAPIGLPATP